MKVVASKQLRLAIEAEEKKNKTGSFSEKLAAMLIIQIVIERSRDLIYLKFVTTDFSPKIISPCAGENSGDLA